MVMATPMKEHSRNAPANLKEALAVTPLLHLLPKQNLAALTNLPYLAPLSDESCLGGEVSGDLIEEMNGIQGEEADAIIEEMASFQDEELGNIKFERFATSNEIAPRIELEGIESVLFLAQEIEESMYQEPVISQPTEWSKLSVRKKYDSQNKKVMNDHNQKYVNKFNNLRKSTTGKKLKRKREVESEATPDTTRKVIKFSVSEVQQIALTQLSTFITVYSPKESDSPKATIPTEKLVGVSDSISKILNDPNIVDIQEISSLQRICHNLLCDNITTIKNDINLTSWNSLEDSLNVFYTCSIATKILLDIFNSSIQDKSLFWEGYLDSAIEFLNLIFQDLLLPISQFPPEESAQILPYKFTIRKLFIEISNILNSIGEYNSKSQLEDQALTKVEIILTQLLFEETYQYDKKSSLALFPMDSLKLSATLVLVDIFRYCKDQRPYLLNELLVNLSKLSTNKVNSRQFKIERGVNVQYFTVILVKYIQCIESEIFGPSNEFKDTIAISNQISIQLTTLLCEKFSSSLRTIFDFITEDLLVLLPYPEWSAVEFILSSLTKQLISVLQNGDIPPQAEVYFLELLGLICERVVSLDKLGKPLTNDNILEMFQDFRCVRFDRENSYQCLQSKVCDTDHLFKLTVFQIDYLTSDIIDTSKIHPVYARFILELGLNEMCSSFLNSLGKFLNSPKVKVRTKAIKILVNISEVRSDLLKSKKIQEELSTRLSDSSPLVRDAVFDFIGKYVHHHPEEADNFCASLCNALYDSGISVRKRAIKLAKELYPMLLKKSNQVEVACRLLKRMDDEEDSVRNNAVSTLIELLFVSSSADVSVLVEICNVGAKVLHNLQVLLEKHVLNSKDTAIQESSHKLIEVLLDMVNDESINQKTSFKDGTLFLLSLCVKSNPDIFKQDQLLALQPLIIEDSPIDSSYCYTLRVLRYSLTNIDSLQPSFIEPVQNYLFKKLSKLSFEELQEAIPSLWRLCEMNSTKPRLINSVIATLKFVYPYMEQKQRRNERGLGKLLQLLGLFAKYCKLQDHYEMFKNSSVGLKNNESVISLILKYIIQFCDDSTNGVIAIRALITACSSHTKLFASDEVVKIFDRGMDSTNIKVKTAILRGFLDFLNEKDDEQATGDKISIFHGVSNLNAVDGVCAGVVQRYLKKVLQLCLSKESQVYLPIQFIKRALELGYANPKVCIATIIALESSSNGYIKKTGMEMHSELFEKHESLIETSYQEGIMLALSVKEDEEVLTSSDFFNTIYGIISGSHSSRKKFVKALCKVTVEKKKLIHVIFYANNIANIEFHTSEELFMIVLQLRRNLVSGDVSEEVNEQLAMVVWFRLYTYLTIKYHILERQIDEYDSHTLDMDLKQTPRVLRDIQLDLNWVVKNINGTDPDIVLKCTEELKQLL
ncbi:Sister chromatid cohesion protein 2 [Spathaspora sp. JA1]|nr:Sister chromatid cohesion protein 2 [Spathaspora sp. JA1]